MKAALLAACVAVALGAAQPANAIELYCLTPITIVGDPGQNLPISAYVSHDGFGGAWNVIYHFDNGRIVRRADQYSLHDTSTSTQTIWDGNLFKQPNLHMHGEIVYATDLPPHYIYHETLTDRDKGNAVILDAKASCVLFNQPASPPVVASTPQPPSVPVVTPRPAPSVPQTTDAPTQSIVQIYPDDGGRSVWVDVQMGSLTRRMLIDTGATSLSIPKSVANELLRRGEASLDDPGQVTIADGSTRAENLIRIDTVRVGNRIVHDVVAGVSPEQAAPLLGFPVLNQAGRFTIDTKARQLIFN
jgi:clan AA aspartic protease (TIGR02281 family)